VNSLITLPNVLNNEKITQVTANYTANHLPAAEFLPKPPLQIPSDIGHRFAKKKHSFGDHKFHSSGQFTRLPIDLEWKSRLTVLDARKKTFPVRSSCAI
jgi:hypothetical protein